MARVTIVGGGYGGITAAKALDDVAEVTLVEQKDTFVSHAAALRAAVDRDWAEKIFLPYDRLLTNGRVVHGTVLTVRGTTVEVSGHGQIEADYLVLATGTAYPFPAKHMESSSVIAKARIERVHTNLEQSSRALIVARRRRYRAGRRDHLGLPGRQGDHAGGRRQDPSRRRLQAGDP